MTALEKIGQECLRVQLELAAKTAAILKHRVYIFSPTCYFTTPPFDIVLIDNIRTNLKEGRTAVLSSAAQAVLKTNSEYRELIPQNKISEDAFGVYINN